MRINARLDEQAEKQLAFIRSATRQSITEIIKRSLDLYYQQLNDQKGIGTRKFMHSDFIGCAEGPEDLSADYKRYLSQGWDEKYGDR